MQSGRGACPRSLHSSYPTCSQEEGHAPALFTLLTPHAVRKRGMPPLSSLFLPHMQSGRGACPRSLHSSYPTCSQEEGHAPALFTLLTPHAVRKRGMPPL